MELPIFDAERVLTDNTVLRQVDGNLVIAAMSSPKVRVRVYDTLPGGRSRYEVSSFATLRPTEHEYGAGEAVLELDLTDEELRDFDALMERVVSRARESWKRRGWSQELCPTIGEI